MIRSPAGFDGADRIKRYLDYYQPSYGVMMLSAGQVAAFSPASLFASGEQGVWYDPSDMTTLFQDAAGTTPVTAVEQPVGLILDKSGRGNHATQSTSASRPVLSARVNLLTYTEQFDDAVWTKATATISANSTPAPNGTNTADTITTTAAAGYVSVSHGFTSGTQYKSSIYIKNVDATSVSFVVQANMHGRITLSDGTLTKVAELNGWVINGSSFTSVGNGWYLATLTYTAGSTVTQTYRACQIDGASVCSAYIWGADLRVANAGVNLPVYQRVVTATDYDTTGFPMYLKFDGTDDSLSSAAIDFSATNKMSVFAGVRKLSDAAAGVIAELTADANNTNGGFSALIASSNGTDRASFGAVTRGTITDNSRQARTYVAPVTAVLAWSMDNGAATQALQLVPRVNGATPGTIYNASAGGTLAGNFANAALFIGRRNNASAPLNGHLYSLIVRGAATDAATITATETWVNGKTYAY